MVNLTGKISQDPEATTLVGAEIAAAQNGGNVKVPAALIQPYSAGLADIAALARSDGNVIFGNGSAWVALNGSTARAALGLTIGSDVQAYSALLTTQASVEFDFTVNSRTAAASVNLSGFSRVLVNRWDNSSKLAPAKYEKVAQPGNVEPTHDFKFQDSQGTWFEIALTQTVSPYMRGCVGDGSTDDATALQSFLDFVAANRVLTANMDGRFGIETGLFLGPSSGTCATQTFIGTMQLYALDAIERMVTYRNMVGTNWDGLLQVVGTGSASYSSRTCVHGVYITASSSRARLGGIFAQYFQGHGVYCDGLSPANINLASFGAVRCYDCGSSTTTGSGVLTATFSARTDSGSSGSTNQRAELEVDVLPPTWLDTNVTYSHCIAMIGGQAFSVQEIDRVAETITVYPWPALATTTGSIEYIFGGGVRTQGGDGGSLFFSRVDAVRCGIGVSAAALYGSTYLNFVSQVCGIGVVIGGELSAATIGNAFVGPYFEANTLDVVRMSSASGSTFIADMMAPKAIALSKCVSIHKPRLTPADTVVASNDIMQGIGGLVSGREYEKFANNGDASASALTLAMDAPGKVRQTHRLNSSTVTINLAADTDLNAAYGYDSATLLVSGAGTWGNPTGTVTFDPPSGQTINGGAADATLSFSGFYGVAEFHVFRNGTNWIVRLVSGREPPEVVTNFTSDADNTLTPWTSAPFQKYTGAITAARTTTLATTNAVAAKTFFRIVRTGGGLFQRIIGSLGALGQNEWMDVCYDGSAYYVRDRGYISRPVTTVSSDADFTFTPHAYGTQVNHTGTLTADRAVTMSTTNAVAGDEVYFRRTGGGAFDLNIGTGPLLSLATNEQGVLRFDGSAWIRKSGPEAV